MDKKNILVTGTGGRSVGSGILHSLVRSDMSVTSRWNVIATDASAFSWGLYQTAQSLLLPVAKDAHYIPALNEMIAKYDISAVIPGTQPELELFAGRLEEIKHAQVIINRRELVLEMKDKTKLQDMLSKLGIDFIETRPFSEWKAIVEKYGFPVVVKPATDSGGSKGVHLIADEEELSPLLLHVDKNTLLCVQPYIGDADEEYTVGIITDREGALIDSIVMKRKLLGLSLMDSRMIGGKSYVISTGYSQGFIVKHKLIQDFSEQLALKINSRGPLNIQLRLHKGAPYVFELHPRFSGTTPIRADVGFNEVDILLRNFLFGEKFVRLNYKYDVAAIRAFEHVIVPIEKMK